MTMHARTALARSSVPNERHVKGGPRAVVVHIAIGTFDVLLPKRANLVQAKLRHLGVLYQESERRWTRERCENAPVSVRCSSAPSNTVFSVDALAQPMSSICAIVWTESYQKTSRVAYEMVRGQGQ